MYLVTSLLLFCSAYAHGLSSSIALPEGEMFKQLQERKFILKRLPKKKGQVWPEIEVWALVLAPPLASAAIFAAYDYQKKYVPNLVKSEVLGDSPPTEVQVRYEMDLTWPASNHHYVHGHRLSMPQKGHYRVDWFMIQSNLVESLEGFVYFRPYHLGKGKEGLEAQGTLMLYRALVTPKARWVGILGRFMARDVERSLRATVAEIERLHSSKNPLVKRYSIKIERTLNGQKAY